MSTAHNYSTTEEEEERDSLSTLFFWKEQGHERLPPRGRAGVGSDGHWGEGFIPHWHQSRHHPSGPQHPLPAGLTGII